MSLDEILINTLFLMTEGMEFNKNKNVNNNSLCTLLLTNMIGIF